MRWHLPTPKEFFIVTQAYLAEDWQLYPKFGHHTGVDYGGHETPPAGGVPLFAVAAGEIIYSDTASSAWGQVLGNHLALYVPAAKCSFLYCHLEDAPHGLGKVKGGEQIGTMGDTGESTGTHLHLEGWHGRFDISNREFASLDDIKKKTFDADHYLRRKIL